MRWPDAGRGATHCLVMGLLALAGCGREDVPADAAPLRSSAAALESGPDLVVTQVRGPASVWHGQGFTATVKVCNQGTDPSYNWPRLELFLSTDDSLTFPDPGTPPDSSTDQVSIGFTDLSQSLQPGQCESLSVYGNAWLPPAAQVDGAYYLAAAIDTTHTEQEPREDNNLLVGGLMGVGNLPDLVVTEVSAPASVRNGHGFTASVKVCNQGTTTASGSSYYPYDRSRVELFLSMDTELTLPDPANPSPSIPMDQVSIGYVELDTLSPGQCVKKDVPASSTLPPDAQGDGAYYLVAAVDTSHVEPELREDNNVHVSGLMGVGHRADLVVTGLSGPSSVRPGQGFMASATVCNQGTLPTNGDTHLALFLSMDTELTLPDPSMPSPGVPANDQAPVGNVNLSQTLQPGQCVTKNVPASADLPPEAQGEGTYYLAAVVDSNHIEQELREDNNVRVGGLVGVGHRSDLVVTGLSGPASLSYGQHFMATVKVCNQGTSSTHGYYSQARLELFLSTDSELTMPDPSMPSPGMPEEQISIGEVVLDALYEGQCVTRSVPANAWLPPAAQGDGAYYLAAAVDTNHAEQELREDNNIHMGGMVGVGSRSDLVVTEVIAPESLKNGESFTASVKVCNQGTESTGSGGSSYGMPRVELFLTLDSELMLPRPSPGYEDDLQSLGYVELNQALPAGQCVTRSVFAHASPPPGAQGDGAYYLVAAVDTGNVEQELREDNNFLMKGLMGVGYRPDLVVTGLSTPASIAPGQSFTSSVKVCNQGTSSTYSGARLELFLSLDTELTLPDPSMPYPGMPEDQSSIGYVELNQPLEPGQCVTKSVSAYATLPPSAQIDGAYYLAAAIDTNHAEQELREDNNVLVSGLVGVGYRSDLVVTGLSAPVSLGHGENFTASVKVCNQGTGPSSSYGGPRVELFLSMDTELTLMEPYSPYPGMPMDQSSLGYVELSQPLAPGQCVTQSVSAYATLPPTAQGDGAYYLAAAVDSMSIEQELREDNNVLVSGLVGVGYRSDLVVTEVSTPASLMHGQSFTASVKVCNQGTSPTSSGSYGPQVELFLSMDAELTLMDPYSPYPGTPVDQVSIGSVELDQPLNPGRCVTKNVSAYAALPSAAEGDGAYYLVAAVDTDHSEQELREDNNVHVSGLVGVGYRPDLVVSEVSAPSSLGHGQSFTASVKVCNQGTTPAMSTARLELFLSMDTELTLPGPSMPPSPSMPTDQQSLGYVDLDQPLNPGQCVTKSVSAHAALPSAAEGDGAYYLVAAVDTAHAEQELREDNNVHVSGLMGVGYRADLVVTAVSGPASIAPGQGFTASVEVCNQGTQPTNGYARLDLFLSMDTEVTPSEPNMPSPGLENEQMPIGYVDLDQPLAPAQCVTKSVPASAQLPHGAQIDSALYLAAIVDTAWSETELREDNNVHVGGLMGVGHRPDLVVTGVSAPASAGHGESFTASVTVCNQGTSPTYGGSYYGGGSAVELFLSTDTELTLPSPGSPSTGMEGDQMPIGYVQLEQALPPGQCVTRSVSASAHLPPEATGDGAYYLVAAVDTNHAEQELREDNNVRVSGLMGVGLQPDLVVTEVNAPASVGEGEGFTASVKVCNQGTVPSSGGASSGPGVELFLSMDTELTLPSPGEPYPSPGMQMDQQTIGYLEVGQPLNPGECVTKDVPAHAALPPAAQGDGAYYLAAAIDTAHAEQELREDNNVHVKGLMGVGSRPDLVVTEVIAPASVQMGQGFTASVKVCNQGTAASMDTAWLMAVISTDAQLSLPDPSSPPPADQMMIGGIDVAPLPAGQCVTKDIPAYASLPAGASAPGVFHLGAIIDTDRWVLELREDNNIRAENTLEVTP